MSVWNIRWDDIGCQYGTLDGVAWDDIGCQYGTLDGVGWHGMT